MSEIQWNVDDKLVFEVNFTAVNFFKMFLWPTDSNSNLKNSMTLQARWQKVSNKPVEILFKNPSLKFSLHIQKKNSDVLVMRV
jgi:hypothetical protein